MQDVPFVRVSLYTGPTHHTGMLGMTIGKVCGAQQLYIPCLTIKIPSNMPDVISKAALDGPIQGSRLV